MDFEPEEQQIVDLLTKLRNQGGTYPRKLLASRRQMFLSQMASVGLGLGVGAGVKTVAKASKGGGLSHLSSMSASSFLEMTLLLAIVLQAGIIVYSYRDKIADYVNSFSPPTAAPTTVSIPVSGLSPTNVVVSDTPTTTGTVTVTVTPSPSSTVTTVVSSTSENDEGNSTTSGNTPPSVTTPQPTNDNGNNGNHYGQTPGAPQPKESPKPTKKGGKP